MLKMVKLNRLEVFLNKLIDVVIEDKKWVL